jgi:chemotaxis protein MotB
MRLAWLTILLVASTTGCVTWQSNLDAKQKELDDSQAQAAAKDKDNQAQIAKLRTQVAELQASVASTQDKNGQLMDRLKKLGQDVESLAAEKGNLSQNLAIAQQQMEALRKQQEQERARAALYQKLVEKLKAMIDSGKLAVQIRNGKMLVKLQNDILFAPGSAQVKPEGKEVLTQLSALLASVPDHNFQVTGHTDNDPIHTAQFPSNWELSTSRAVNVTGILVGAGFDPKRVSAAGYAEFDPVSPNDSPESKQKNRRIEIVVQPNIDELPKLDDPSLGKS